METDSQGRLGNEYAQWWARTGALSRCPILPHPTLEWSDNLRKKAKRPMNRFALDMTLRPFQELLKGVHAKFLAGDLDFNESLVAVWQKCDAKMRASMAHLPDPFVQRYCIERLQVSDIKYLLTLPTTMTSLRETTNMFHFSLHAGRFLGSTNEL